MSEEVGAFGWSEGREQAGDGSPEGLDCSGCGLAQMSFEFGEGLLDGIEIRRVRRQIAQGCARCGDGGFDGRAFVAGEVVHDDNVAGPEAWHKDLLDIGEEGFGVHRAVEHQRGGHARGTKAADKSGGFPVTPRRFINQSLANRTSPVAPQHIGAGSGFVDEYEPRRIKKRLLSLPRCPRCGHVRPVLLGGVQNFFYKTGPAVPDNTRSPVPLR